MVGCKQNPEYQQEVSTVCYFNSDTNLLVNKICLSPSNELEHTATINDNHVDTYVKNGNMYSIKESNILGLLFGTWDYMLVGNCLINTNNSRDKLCSSLINRESATNFLDSLT